MQQGNPHSSNMDENIEPEVLREMTIPRMEIPASLFNPTLTADDARLLMEAPKTMTTEWIVQRDIKMLEAISVFQNVGNHLITAAQNMTLQIRQLQAQMIRDRQAREREKPESWKRNLMFEAIKWLLMTVGAAGAVVIVERWMGKTP